MKALLMKPGAAALEIINLSEDDSKHDLEVKRLVGNWTTSCFRVQSEGSSIVGYCDDEFFLHPEDTKWCVLLGDTLRLDAPYLIGNPVVIVGVDNKGRDRSLSYEEISHFTLSNQLYEGDLSGERNVVRLRLLQWEG